MQGTRDSPIVTPTPEGKKPPPNYRLRRDSPEICRNAQLRFLSERSGYTAIAETLHIYDFFLPSVKSELRAGQPSDNSE